MSRPLLFVLCAPLLSLALGCATVKFYEDGGLKKETGLQYYNAKPYLLVSNTGAKDKPVEVSVVSLPDVVAPRYAKYRPGLGTHEFSIALSNGMLSSYGQKADSKIPETLTALGSLATSAATAGTTAGLFRAQSLDFAERRALAARLEAVGDEISDAAGDPHVSAALIGAQRTAAQKVAAQLDAAAAILVDPNGKLDDAAKVLRNEVIGKIDAIKVGAPGNDVALTNYNGKVDTWKSEVTQVANRLNPPAPTTPFELYEIRQNGSRIELIRIQAP